MNQIAEAEAEAAVMPASSAQAGVAGGSVGGWLAALAAAKRRGKFGAAQAQLVTLQPSRNL